MSAFYDLNKTPRNILNQAIVRAIVSENNGALFDPSDLSTLFQDAAGTTPVTAVEQPVGKMLDKSGNGYHATQSITASRPVLSARYNLLTKTEDFSDAVWFKNEITVTSNVVESPIGTLSADKITKGTLPAGIFIENTVTPSSTYNFSCFVKDLSFGLSNHRFAFYNVTTSAFIVAEAVPTYYSLNNGWFIGVLSVSVPSTCNKLRSYPFRSTLSTSGEMYIWGAQLNVGTSPLQYQRVNTATDYDTDPRYFPKYLRFDGVDDYLNLPHMGLYAGGEMSIIAARNAVSQSTDTYIISERSTTDADPKYFPSRQLASGGNMDAYISDDNAAVVLDTTGSAFGGAADKVIRSVVDTGSNIKLYKNGVLAADDNYTRAGTLTLNNTTLGASVSTTTGNYASIKLYGLIVTKKALSPAQRVMCERYLSRKAGVAL